MSHVARSIWHPIYWSESRCCSGPLALERQARPRSFPQPTWQAWESSVTFWTALLFPNDCCWSSVTHLDEHCWWSFLRGVMTPWNQYKVSYFEILQEFLTDLFSERVWGGGWGERKKPQRLLSVQFSCFLNSITFWQFSMKLWSMSLFKLYRNSWLNGHGQRQV